MCDFPADAGGKAVPYGVYDVKRNEGWVNVGIDHDTVEFAVESISRLWKFMGREWYPDAKKLLITADGGGSNGSRVKLWKIDLQKLANEFNLIITVCHFPPGMSKWNRIEHRLFSFITKNWIGKPLTSVQVVVNLIANTRTEKGLTVKCELDKGTYEKGIVVTVEELSRVSIKRDSFHGERNYMISPNVIN